MAAGGASHATPAAPTARACCARLVGPGPIRRSAACAAERVVSSSRDHDGRPICELCRLQARRRSRLDELNGQIVAVLADTVRPLNNDQVIDAVEQTAPKIPDRSLLLEQLLRDVPLSLDTATTAR